MIKVTYYVGIYDKDTCEKEMSDSEIINIFNELFENYTLQYANGVYHMKDTKTVIRKQTFIITTFVEEYYIEVMNSLEIYNNVETLKNKLNQETILVEVCRPEVMFL